MSFLFYTFFDEVLLSNKHTHFMLFGIDGMDYSSVSMNLHLLTWCYIERHLFIFDSQMMKEKWCLILFHYLPLIICLFIFASYSFQQHLLMFGIIHISFLEERATHILHFWVRLIGYFIMVHQC
jgi:hypothetical protein